MRKQTETRELREVRTHSRPRSSHRHHSRAKASSKPIKYGGIFNTLFRQIIFSGAILALLFGIKGIESPAAKALNSHLANSFKYNIEYDWIISNINKSTEYILSMFSNNQ